MFIERFKSFCILLPPVFATKAKASIQLPMRRRPARMPRVAAAKMITPCSRFVLDGIVNTGQHLRALPRYYMYTCIHIYIVCR